MDMRFDSPAPAMEVQPFDADADRQRVVAALKDSPEIDQLTSTIDVSDLTTILNFGKRSAEEVSGAADAVLRSMRMEQTDRSGEMFQALGRLMGQFDPDELGENQSRLRRLFSNPRRQLDGILQKYQTMGDQVDRIYVQLKQYEAELMQANRQLEAMFQANVGYFHELEKYIVAGDQGCQEIRDYIEQLQRQLDAGGDQLLGMELITLRQALTMLEQRTHDLRTAECVALQSIQMINSIQFSNMNLVHKINSAFIITLPVFKQALAQAILLKRQKIQQDAISALDRQTNQVLLRSARNATEQAKLSDRLAPAGKDALESSWRTIMDGLNEISGIQQNARAQRSRDQEKLEAIKRDFAKRK